jgi:hypothetical protein
MRLNWIAGLALALAAAGAAHAGSFDARRAADIAALVTSHGASGALKQGDDGKVYFNGQAGQMLFGVHFQSCDAARTLCKTMLLSASWDSKRVTVEQINRWNRWTLYCPAYLDSEGAPDLWYSLAVSANTSQDDVAGPLGTWMDCLRDFDSFVGDPEAFLQHNADADAPASPAAPAASGH